MQLPATIDTPKGVLTTSGRSFGLHVGPNQLIPSMPARLTVRSLIPVTIDVEIKLAVWSLHQRELGMRPRRNLAWWVPTDRYLDAAIAVVDELATYFTQEALATDAAAHLRPTEAAPATDTGDEDDLALTA